MNIQLLSVVAGSSACNAKCFFCISKMTPDFKIKSKEPDFNYENLEKACRYAEVNRVSTCMITGKGEPTLFPSQVTKILKKIDEFNIPIVELQTNGTYLLHKKMPNAIFTTEWSDYSAIDFLRTWKILGLNTISISIVSHDPEENRKVYLPHKKEYVDLEKVVKRLHDVGFTVRLSCTLIKGIVDCPDSLLNVIKYADKLGVEQLKFTPVNHPTIRESKEVYDATKDRVLDIYELTTIKNYLHDNGTKVLELPDGGEVFDFYGQNVCYKECLTKSKGDNINSIIYFPDGHLRYSWEHKGAILF